MESVSSFNHERNKLLLKYIRAISKRNFDFESAKIDSEQTLKLLSLQANFEEKLKEYEEMLNLVANHFQARAQTIQTFEEEITSQIQTLSKNVLAGAMVTKYEQHTYRNNGLFSSETVIVTEETTEVDPFKVNQFLRLVERAKESPRPVIGFPTSAQLLSHDIENPLKLLIEFHTTMIALPDLERSVFSDVESKLVENENDIASFEEIVRRIENSYTRKLQKKQFYSDQEIACAEAMANFLLLLVRLLNVALVQLMKVAAKNSIQLCYRKELEAQSLLFKEAVDKAAKKTKTITRKTIKDGLFSNRKEINIKHVKDINDTVVTKMIDSFNEILQPHYQLRWSVTN